jgi:hypothetical protein
MNNGKFDGGGLSPEQKQLRNFYSELLNYVKTSEAITSGEYIDLTLDNIASGNFSDRVHAFLRYSGDERLLMLNSFNDRDIDIKVQVPRDAFSKMGLDPNGVYIARDMIWREAEVGFDSDMSFTLHLKPFSSYIFKIK